MNTGTSPQAQQGFLLVEDVAAMFPVEGGKKMHVNTICSWITKGVRGIRLLAWKPGKRYYTTAEAVQEFLNAIHAAKNGKAERAAGVAKKSAARKAALKKAAKRHGISK